MIVTPFENHIRTQLGTGLVALFRDIRKESLSMRYDDVNDVTVEELKIIGKSIGYDERSKFENLLR